MKFGPKFEKMIVEIYSSQKASVMINGDFTKRFNIVKGLRQGCPMSPLIFILAIEILLTQIRKNKEIIGTKIKKEEYKIQAFADDMVFFIEDPLETGIFNERIRGIWRSSGIENK
uniref:Reverse transcriptase domain-containing protein n=1 Tax=Micrurus paraensis TaxID=1970185 RepID=A0A2D4K6Y1_9SAUR